MIPSPKQVQKFRVAVYGVLVEDGRVLLTNTRVPSGTVTNFPGGGLELGESPIAAVAREFKEETSIEVAVRELLFCTQTFQQNPEYPTEQLMHIFYRVTRVSGEVREGGNSDDVVSTVWVAPKDLHSYRIFDVDREFINHQSFQTLFTPADG